MLGEIGVLLDHRGDPILHTDDLLLGSARLQTNDLVRHLPECREVEDEIATKLLTIYLQVFEDEAADLDCLQGVDAETEEIGIFVKYRTFPQGDTLLHLFL